MTGTKRTGTREQMPQEGINYQKLTMKRKKAPVRPLPESDPAQKVRGLCAM
jgi:hypothetical protein